MRFRYGSVNQFKPYVAAWVYHKFKPTRILDFSAGWGDRCCAAMALNIDYIGIDTNTSLKTSYARMIKKYRNLSSHPSTSKVKMIYKDSAKVNYKQLPKYDFIFTSPPYFTLEKYKNMPQYDGYQDWLRHFLKPVLVKSIISLSPKGYICLNVPHLNIAKYGNTPNGVFGSVCEIIGKPYKKILYPTRVMTGRVSRQKKKKVSYHEYMYVWKRTDVIILKSFKKYVKRK